MSNRDIFPYDWTRGLLDDSRSRFSKSLLDRNYFSFGGIADEIDRVIDLFDNLESNIPKELVKEYKTKDGNKVKEVGPLVYGYSVTIGPDGKPKVREFGNVKSVNGRKLDAIEKNSPGPKISSEREPLADVNSTENEVRLILEIPGVKKEDIQINVNENVVEIKTTDSLRRYHKTLELPENVDIDSAKSTYNNGILEVTFNRKAESKPKGREIKID